MSYPPPDQSAEGGDFHLAKTGDFYLAVDRGLKTQEALAWCGFETLTGREVHRLIRGVVDADGDHLNQGEHLAISGDAG